MGENWNVGFGKKLWALLLRLGEIDNNHNTVVSFAKNKSKGPLVSAMTNGTAQGALARGDVSTGACRQPIENYHGRGFADVAMRELEATTSWGNTMI